MDPILTKHINDLNRYQLAYEVCQFFIRLLRSALLTAVIMGIWISIKPLEWQEQLIIGILSIIFFVALSWQWNGKKITEDSVLKSLEIKYPESQLPAFSLKEIHPRNKLWLPLLERESESLKKKKLKFISYKLSTLLIPALLWIAVSTLFPGAFGSAIHGVKKVVASFSHGASLSIVQGITDPSAQDTFKLELQKNHEINLLEQNRVEVTVVAEENKEPFITLKPIDGSVTQTFRLASKNTSHNALENVYTIAFSIRESSELFVSSISGNKAVAKIKVLRLPLPAVSLKVVGQKEDPWPDELPLPLEIKVSSESPLQLVRLKIESEGQIHTELVSNILAQDKTELTTTYSLLLENYVQQDLSLIRITAEALDRHLPNPLLGISDPLTIKTASAYGRYRESLHKLREVKEGLDRALGDGVEKLDKNISETMLKGLQQAENSPFFDALDRHIMGKIYVSVDQISEKMDRESLMATQEELNRFLFEHESLDDRERDRDFFVAARSLSRLVEKPMKERQIPVSIVANRLKDFLNERHERWQLRLKYVQDSLIPQDWPQIQKKPFHKMLDRIVEHTSQGDKGNQKALETLSQIVADYRKWIEDLEKAEDESRAQMEQKRQQGLADSRKQLRELQKRQGKISQKLDRAMDRPASEMADQWGAMRMDQNANIQNTKSLEAKLRSLSPLAAERIKAALESMNMTVDAGNKEAFVEAESASDLAGRLLRKADSAAQKSQKQKMRRGRRRRVTSDQYYGSSVAGGDVEIRREYEVNRRYREDILEELRRASQNEERDRQLLDNYLRRVIR